MEIFFWPLTETNTETMFNLADLCDVGVTGDEAAEERDERERAARVRLWGAAKRGGADNDDELTLDKLVTSSDTRLGGRGTPRQSWTKFTCRQIPPSFAYQGSLGAF